MGQHLHLSHYHPITVSVNITLEVKGQNFHGGLKLWDYGLLTSKAVSYHAYPMSHAHSYRCHVAAMLRLLSFLQNLNQNMWDPYWRTKSAYNLILKHLYCRDNLCKGNEYGSICNPMKLWRTLRVNFENFKTIYSHPGCQQKYKVFQ